jgi:hypothetical protein
MEDSEAYHSNGILLSAIDNYIDLDKDQSLDLNYNGITKNRKLNNTVKHETSEDQITILSNN